jgi:hypothetical protein
LIDDAVKAGNRAEARNLGEEHLSIRSNYEHELRYLETMFWSKMARRYGVSLPDRTPVISLDRFWDESPAYECYILTQEGVQEARRRVREEKKWRQEWWRGWISLGAQLLTLLTGLIGALIGLAAILSHHISR